MTKKIRGRTTATPKTFYERHRTAVPSHIKALIVRVAVWGVIPASFAAWLIQRGGLTDA